MNRKLRLLAVLVLAPALAAAAQGGGQDKTYEQLKILVDVLNYIQDNYVDEPDAQKHAAFSYRPETGEETYHSFLAVPIVRGGEILGVLTIQNKTHRAYSDEDVEVPPTTAMAPWLAPRPSAERLNSMRGNRWRAATNASRRPTNVAKRPAIQARIVSDANGQKSNAAPASVPRTPRANR